MKIEVLEGSPNKNGPSNMLAGEFIRGAKDAGHEVAMIDTARADIHPCIGCIYCGYDGPCVQKDDVGEIRRQILGADMLVFVTPLYYYGMSAQLKTLVRYLNFDDMGAILSKDCSTPTMTKRSEYMTRAYDLRRG